MTEFKTPSTKEELFHKARNLFSNAYVDHLSRTGLDLIETKSQGAFIYDEDHNRYLDGYSSAGTCNLGRRPEPLAKALQEAAAQTDQGNFVLISKEKVLLAERLASFVPDPLSCSYFTVVRGEAMDAACKLARGKTGRPSLVSFSSACHGDSGFALSLSDHPDRQHFEPLIPNVDRIPLNNMDVLKKKVTKDTAALIIETIQVENGCAGAEHHFLKQAQEHCRKVGALVIADETQTGFGRTGKKFSIEHSALSPDILVFGEAICSGMFNMCGLSFTPEVKTFFDQHPLIHLCTYGGHDIGCRVAASALDLYDEIKPWDTAACLEEPFTNILTRLRDENPDLISRISVTGLLGAVCFKSREQAARFCCEAGKNGVILRPGEVDPATVIIRPPLTIGEAELGILETALDKAAG